MRDLLDAQSVSWKYYAMLVKGGNAGLWSAYDAIKAVRYSKEWTANVTTSPNVIFQDLKSGNLPAVPGLRPTARTPTIPTRREPTASTSTTVRRGSPTSSIGRREPVLELERDFVLWDDWGGFYDHVAPPCLYHRNAATTKAASDFACR